MNLPNKLTILRVILVPFFMFFIVVPVLPENLSRVLAAAIFLAATLTDMADGKIARSRGLVTNFGKVMDPLADKFMIFAALISIVYAYDYIKPVFIWVAAVIILRELAVISLRLVVSNTDGVIIAAQWAGKLKTGFQCAMVLTILLEPVLASFIFENYSLHILAYATIFVALALTIYSGITYFMGYWKYLNTNL